MPTPLPQPLSDAESRSLIEAAQEVRLRAYARYSSFQVGAALLTVERKVFTGANVENACYGLGICAERSAVVSAVSAGHQQFVAMAVASKGGVTPCGACRQFLAEFGMEWELFMVDVDRADAPFHTTLESLLPHAFNSTQLPNNSAPPHRVG